VERRIGDETGAAILWVTGMRSVKQLGGKFPSGPEWGKPIRQMLMFDNLIRNIDRNAGNVLIGRPGDLILIDHSRAFTTDKKLQNKVERVDAELWERMQTLTRENLARALGPWLDDDAIAAIIERRDAMAATIDKLIAKTAGRSSSSPRRRRVADSYGNAIRTPTLPARGSPVVNTGVRPTSYVASNRFSTPTNAVTPRASVRPANTSSTAARRNV
jgi:hypothetical protein